MQPADESPRPRLPDRPVAILVVDDEESLRDVLYDVLTDEGYAVTLASDGDEAWRTLELEVPALVLLDCMMPHTSGPELLTLIRASERHRSLSGRFHDGGWVCPRGPFDVPSGPE